MSYSTKKTALIITAISLALILMSTAYTISNIYSVSNASNIEYPTSLASGVAPRNVIGVVIDKSLTVRMVEPRSAAEQAGLEVGDIILEINGQPVKNIDDVKKEISDVVIVLPTDSPESAKLSQEVKDATAAAYIQANLTSRNTDKVVINVMKKTQRKVKIDIDKKPQEGTPSATPTPVSSDDLYF